MDGAARHLQGSDAVAWSERLEADLDNIRAALRRSLDDADADTALKLGAALWRFWLEHGYLSEGREWLEEALSAEHHATPTRASALTRLGVPSLYQGDDDRAQRSCSEALEAFREASDSEGAATALTGLGLAARNRGSYDEATELLQEALAISESIGDPEGAARTLDRLGITAWLSGDDKRGWSMVEDSLRRFEARGDVSGTALALHDLALIAVWRTDLAGASELLDRCLTLLRELGDRRNTAKALWTKGDLRSEQGDQEAAAGYLEESLRLMIEFGDRWFTALGLESAACVATAAGDSERASHLFGAADAVLESIDAPLPTRLGARHDARIETARSELGEDRFTAAVDAGRRLGPHEAVDLVAPAHVPTEAHESLTPREVEVLGLVATGLTDAEVAERLVVSLRTVHAHLRSIYRKLDVRSRSAATRYAIEHELRA